MGAGYNKLKDPESKEKNDDVCMQASSSKSSPQYILKVYSRRWLILFLSCLSIFQRGFNQSCYGPINAVFVKYMHVQPYQVDWFILTQSVVFLSMALPLSWITSRLGFRNTYILMTLTLLIGFLLTTIGVSQTSGYYVVIAGQTIMGFSNIISWSIPPPTAARWFPTNEVAIAVALQVVGRGVGESFGSIITPALVSVHMTNEEITHRMLILFCVVTAISALLFLGTLVIVKDKPPLPPSEAQAKALASQEEDGKNGMSNLKIGEAMKLYWTTIVELFQNPYFVVVWFTFGAVNPVLRNNSVLLSSLLVKSFPNAKGLDHQAGYVLMGGWITYTIGGFIAGPIIAKTRAYKGVVLFSVSFECLSCLTIMLGVHFLQVYVIGIGVLLQGLFLGMANTSLFEILVEVTYPKPTMLVTMVNIIGMGIFRLIYPLIGRILLSNVSATASTAFPLCLTLISSIIIAVINPPYKRYEAGLSDSEKQKLINEKDS